MVMYACIYYTSCIFCNIVDYYGILYYFVCLFVSILVVFFQQLDLSVVRMVRYYVTAFL